jgi:putative membrane protein
LNRFLAPADPGSDHHHHHGPGDGGTLAEWVAALPALLLIAAALVCYLTAARRAAAAPRGWPTWRTASWAAGCALLAVAWSPLPTVPVFAGSTEHMLRHLLVGMFAPVALVLAAPLTLVLRSVSPRSRRPIAGLLRSPALHVVGHPVTAAVLDIGGLALVMLTPIHAATHTNPLAHHAVHLHYLAAGYLFAWSIAGPDPAPRRPGLPTRAAVLVLAAGTHAWLAKYLYAHAGTLPPGLHDPAGTRDAARLMYYGGDLAELLLATAMFAGWYVRRRRRAGTLPRRLGRQGVAG